MRLTLVLLGAIFVLASCTQSGLPETTTSLEAAPTTVASTTTTITSPATTTTEEKSTTTSWTYDIIIEGGTESTPELTFVGPDRIEYRLGDLVRIRIQSSVSDELHVHGYDRFFELGVGSLTEVVFAADIPGIFEAELEGLHALLFELVVIP